MNFFQLLMLAATLFFAYQIVRHVQNLEEPENESAGSDEHPSVMVSDLIEEADRAFSENDLNRAREALLKARETDGRNTEILNKLAFITGKLGNENEAIELYEQSLEIDENDDLTHNAIASLYRSHGALERAQDHYRKALEIDDQYSTTYYNYANLLVDMHEYERAKEMYQRAIELQSDFDEARSALSELERRS